MGGLGSFRVGLDPRKVRGPEGGTFPPPPTPPGRGGAADPALLKPRGRQKSLQAGGCGGAGREAHLGTCRPHLGLGLSSIWPFLHQSLYKELVKVSVLANQGMGRGQRKPHTYQREDKTGG